MKVEIGKNKFIYDYTEEQELRIKEDLTLENPKYVQAKKFSKFVGRNVPKSLFYYVKVSKGLIVPRGYTPPFEHEIVKDERLEVSVEYPQFRLDLRDTQRDARKHYLNDPDKGLIVLPTGKGKSILGLNLAYTLRQRTLVIVHKDDLVDGWTKDCELCFGKELRVGIYKAQKKQIGEQITIATIQTLNRLSKEDLMTFQENFGLVIIDECHHIASSSFDLLHNFSACYKLGLSATPERSDGLTKAMTLHLGECAFKYEADANDEDILPVEIKVKSIDIDVKFHAKKIGKKYVLATDEEVKKGGCVCISDINYKYRPRVPFFEIDTKVLTSHRFQHRVIRDILGEYKAGHSCVCFFSQKKHIELYKELLVEMGVPSTKILLYYGDSKMSKEEMKAIAESRKALITLATYSIATEGTNVKAWEVAFLVSSVNNEKNVEQAVGRIRRSKEGKINPVLVYDYKLPNVYSIGTKHYNTRQKRYKKLGFKIVNRDKNNSVVNSQGNKSMFTRGFNK